MDRTLVARLDRARFRCPELRLGQLLVNAASARVGGDGEALRRTLFYVADEELVAMVEDFVSRVHPPSGLHRLDLPISPVATEDKS